MSDARAGDDRLLAMLEQSFQNLGAAPDQARVMAMQLLKRARQVATERGIAESAAMSELLGKVVSGRKGDYPGHPTVSAPARPPSPP